EAVVAVDDPAIQVVQVGGRETSAIERHQRAQVGRQHGQDFHDHPVGLDARLLEAFKHFQTFGNLLDLGVGTGGLELSAQGFHFAIDVDGAQQFTNRFGTHQCMEVVAVFFGFGEEIVVGHDLTTLERSHAGLDYAPCFEIQNPLDVAQGHVQHHTQAGRQALQEPDVRNGAGQLDVTHTLAAHLGNSDLNAAFFADNAAMLETLVLAAKTFVVFYRAKNLGAEQAITLGLERAVVDGLGLTDFTVRPRAHLLGRRNTDLDGVELLVLRDLFEKVE